MICAGCGEYYDALIHVCAHVNEAQAYERRLKEEARAEERAAIVAWLRAEADVLIPGCRRSAMLNIIDRIERGEHRSR